MFILLAVIVKKLFRNLSCFSEMLQYLCLASFVHICCGQAVTSIDASLPKVVGLYSTQRISCDITGTLKTGVRWIRPDGVLISSCAGATNCLPNSGYSNPEATTTRNVLEIKNTTVQDGGEWTCIDGTDGTQSTGRLDDMKNSSACVINSTSSLVKGGSQVTLMVSIKQYYCSATALFQLGNANVTLSGTPTGVDDNEGSVTVLVTRSETLDLYMVCGGATFKQNCNVNLITDNPTSTATPRRPTTPTPGGICKDINCYFFLLLLLLPLLIILIIIVIIWCRRKKKKTKSNSNELSDEVQVNNHKSDQMRL